MKKLGIIVQRYGIEINGGAEYHARLIAEKLDGDYDIEVFTTTAIDYITWKHYYDEGSEIINGIRVNRFRVSSPRDPKKFGQIQKKIFEDEHTINDEISWLEEEGPVVPELIKNLEEREDDFLFFIFFSYRYYQSFYGVKRFQKKAVLVPTAEHDEVLYMKIFKDIFRLPAGIVYNSVEEKEIINRISDNHDVPGEIVGVGSEIPEVFDPEGFKSKFDISGKYLLYVGRLDKNKGVPELLDFFITYIEEQKSDVKLVLIGRSYIDIPENINIIHLGFLSDKDKFDALSGCESLIIPSQFESLSMVTLEAWALGKPVIANGRTEVLKGQCMRSNAGLWYTNYEQFKSVLNLLFENEEIRKKMGENGEIFFNENYSWEIIRKKYKNLLKRI